MTTVSIDDIDILAEPDHVSVWEAFERKLDAHVVEDQEFKAAVTKRIDGIDGQLAAILTASRAAAADARASNRWSRAGTLLGGAIVIGLIVCGAVIAQHFPWLFTR